MPDSSDKRVARRRRAFGAALALIALAAVPAGSALAAQDQLKGGSVVMQLRGSHGLKLKPSTLTLPITGGAIDPVDGSGTANVSGTIKSRKGREKAKIKVTSVTFGANGGPGRISAKIGKRKVSSFAKLSGGSVARDGWGARISGVGAKLSGKGAKALGFRGVKAGRPLGGLSATTIPATVAVVPGSGELTLNTNPLGAFVMKLSAHCLDPLLGSPPGVAPIAPATTSGVGGAVYHFPVTGGAVAPDFSDGDLVSGGGQAITKNTSLLNPSGCPGAAPAVGTQLVSRNPRIQFGLSAFATDTTLPDGFTLLAALGPLDFSTGARSIDPNTKALSVTGATLTLSAVTASTLNQFFPNQSGNASNDFAAGDQLGTVDATGQLR